IYVNRFLKKSLQFQSCHIATVDFIKTVNKPTVLPFARSRNQQWHRHQPASGLQMNDLQTHFRNSTLNHHHFFSCCIIKGMDAPTAEVYYKEKSTDTSTFIDLFV